jgi:hypothetical protein
MATHQVKVKISATKKFGYNKHCIHACAGDTIEWVVDKQPPFAIIIKAFVSPLDWDSAVLRRGELMIVGRVREDAEPGFYPYGLCAFDGTDLLLDDPEIIIRRPDGRG